MIYIVGDTETAGLGAEKKPVEIALKLIDPETLTALKSWQSLVDPEIPINPDAMAIHGITNEMVALAPTSAQFTEHVLGAPFTEDICLIGHNIQFDKPMLDIIGNITHTVCTLNLARAYLKGPSNFKLGTLKEFYSLVSDRQAHRAMADVETAFELLKLIVKVSGRSLEQHAMTVDRVVHTMPFGKHAGKPLHEMPPTYVNWLLGLPDIDPNLKTSLQTVKLLQG